ncbi:hypothetical protein Pst134EB_008711 [Puccinia striiformis f. sp. tritici]|nr:hypothetical protein Pst134EB_008711 [Puccinia striiformis f. sp. tritici]
MNFLALQRLPFLCSLLWCLAVVSTTNTAFDLNKPPEEVSPEAHPQLPCYESESTIPPIPIGSSAPSAEKRKCSLKLPVGGATSVKRACMFHAQGASSSTVSSQDLPEGRYPISMTKENRNAIDSLFRILTSTEEGPKDNARLPVNLDPIQQPTVAHPNLICRVKPVDLPQRNSVLGSGQVVEALIKKYYDSFCERIDSQLFKASHTLIRHRHSWLPIALAKRLDDEPGSVLRVLSARSQEKLVQTAADINALYKILATAVYEKHMEFLRSLQAPMCGVRIMQTDLLDWIDRQIFSPRDSLPVIDTIGPEQHTNWGAETGHFPGPIGATQEALIRYFTQSYPDARPSDLVNHLLETYRSINIYPEEVVRKRQFARKVALITNLADDSEISTFRRQHITPKHEDYSLFSPFFLQFEVRFPKTNFKRCEKRRYHPDLSMAMFYYDEAGLTTFRVLKVLHGRTEQSFLVSFDSSYQMFRRLARAMDHIHVKILHELESIEHKSMWNKRTGALGALIEEILQPKVGFPIMGDVKVNNNLPPWEDREYLFSTVFGETQLNFIKYFSERPETEDAKGAVAFFLASWYQDNHLDEFNSLIEALEKKESS